MSSRYVVCSTGGNWQGRNSQRYVHKTFKQRIIYRHIHNQIRQSQKILWHREKKIMFPGYMFIDTDNPSDIYEQLKNVPELTKILGREGKDFISIEPGKESMFKAMVNEAYEIPVSTGIIEGDRVIVKDGPLVGMEAYIKKIDRHKRIAVLNAEMFEQEIKVSVGLEIVQKM